MRQKRTISALGLGKINRSVEKELSPQVAGMISKVNHLIEVKKFKMKLHTLKPAEGSTKKGKRIARGQGSGGGTSTRGSKEHSQGLAILERLALKVDKCHYKEEFQSLDLDLQTELKQNQ